MDDDVSACHVRGWRFEARHGAALSSAAREQLAREQLRLAPRVPLPEMVFADSAFSLALPSRGVALRFDTEAALRIWAERHAGPDWDQTNFDFTFSTAYGGDIERVRVEPTTERLPLDKLRQHVEILFYDRVLLFEDDVRDLGEIFLEVKTRVMAFGFLVLCRHYCRVDGKSVRLVDTRYYHEFGQEFIWRDHETREATIPELRKLLYANATMTTDEEHFRQLDFSADAVYPVLTPKETATEKLFLAAPSSPDL